MLLKISNITSGGNVELHTMQVDWERLKEEIKPMQAQLGREHIAFYSQYDPDSQQYTYSPHGLIFSDETVARADGKSGLILYEIQNSESKHLNKVVLIHAPISRQAIDEMRIWARGSGSSPGQHNARTSFMSNSVSGDSDQECDTVLLECEFDDIIVTPEDDWMDDPFFNPESLDEEDDSGGFYPPQPDDTDCEVAYGCGGGVGPGPVPEDCPTGQVKGADGNCIDEEVDPCDGDDPPDYCSEPDLCLGDPLPNPEITSSGDSGIEGGRYRVGDDAVRNSGETPHRGLDITAPLNSNLFAIHSGTVIRTDIGVPPGKYPPGTPVLGNSIMIQSIVNGKTILFQYGHLNGVSVNEEDDIIAGQIIGLTGNTGNANSPRITPHVHINVWELENGNLVRVDPENYLTTTFDQEGNIKSTCN